jgi:hypothetical protein
VLSPGHQAIDTDAVTMTSGYQQRIYFQEFISDFWLKPTTGKL